jgi:hypothetical protein
VLQEPHLRNNKKPLIKIIDKEYPKPLPLQIKQYQIETQNQNQ